jgi:hypothetical protein
MRFDYRKSNNLATTVANAILNIDTEAGKARLRYITDVPGQQAIYTEKLVQAKDYLANTPADTSAHKYIGGEASARSINATQAATEIVAIASAWEDLSVAIESKRIEAKAAINALPETATVQDVIDISYPAIQILKSI